MAQRVERAAEKHGANRVMAVSFTRSAARVIASRTELPRENVGTLHALAYRALGRPTIAETKADEWNEHVDRDPELALDSSGAKDVDLDGDRVIEMHYGETKTGSEKLSAIQTLRAIDRPEHLWPVDLLDFWSRWRSWKREANYLDFTDLIEVAADMCPTAPGDPAIFCADETQDLSPLEWKLVRVWGEAAETGLLVAADPAQCIYNWKGASPRLFFEPPIPAEDYRVLRQSFRVPRRVHARAVSWLAQSQSDVMHEYLPRDADGAVRRMPSGGPSASTWQSPRVIAEIAAADARKTGRTHMIVASCAYMLQPLLRELRELGEPFHNPYRLAAGAWNPMRGATERLVDFLGPVRPDLVRAESATRALPIWADSDSSQSAREGQEQLGRQRLWTWTELWSWVSELRASDTIRHGAKVELEERAKADARRPIDDRDPVSASELRRILEPGAHEQLKRDLQTDRPWTFIAERLLPSRTKLWRYALNVADKRGASALLERPKLIIGTIHSVKGGEADCVWVWPDLSPSAHAQWSGGDDGRDAITRTFYVAMTRAREELVLCGASGPMAVDW